MEAKAFTERDILSLPSGVEIPERYVLQGQLAPGGTCTLWLAQDSLLDHRLVALKVVHAELTASPATRQIAIREASIGRQLCHTGLIRIFDVHAAGSSHYVVMEYLDGTSLKSLLARKKLSYNEALQIIQSVAEPISYLHSVAVVHSDIKPSNIFITRDGQIKLIDLANCRRDSNGVASTVQLDENHFFGYSLDYSSPQVIKDRPASASDDVFSLACVLYEMLEGTSPIPAKKSSSDMSLSSVKKPASINVWQWQVMKRAMNTEAGKRTRSVSEFIQQFRRARYTSIILIAFIMSLAVAVLGVGLWSTNKNQPDTNTQVDSQYETVLDAERLINVVRQQPPEKRFDSLSMLSGLPFLAYQGALTVLYPDVVPPVIAAIETQLFTQKAIPNFDSMLLKVDQLLEVYPTSAKVHQLQAAVLRERESMIEAHFVQVAEEMNRHQFDHASGVRIVESFIGLIQLGISNPAGRIGAGYGDVFSETLSQWVEEQNWQSIQRAKAFVSLVGAVLPEYELAWGSLDQELLGYASQMASYISSVGARGDIATFPEEAVKYFLGERLQELTSNIELAWFNKDLNRYVDDLLSLRSHFKMPASYLPYQSVNQLLAEKINQKIHYHQSKGQAKSAQQMVGLLTKLKSSLS